jgi:SPX domain protein involved in polyphosphate accumulation
MMQTKLHFSRFEFKYILPLELRNEIESELGYFLQLDPYVASKPEMKYMVRSLYYDDPSFRCYYDKTDGMLHRSKFRLRTYTDNYLDNCATFLEIKGRHDALVFKHREKLNNHDKNILPGDKCSANEIIKYFDNKGDVVERFEYEVEKKDLRPIMLIDYYRRPYVSKYDAEFRLTFDERIRAIQTESLYPSGFYATKDVLRGYTIMEVKFRYHMPSWFHRIIQAYELRRVSVSKIVSGIDVWDLTPNLE